MRVVLTLQQNIPSPLLIDVWIQELRCCWCWRDWQLHHPPAPSGQGRRNHRRRRCPHSPGKLCIQVCWSNARTDQLSQESKTTVDPSAKLISVDYSNKESIKTALTGVDVVISRIALAAVHL